MPAAVLHSALSVLRDTLPHLVAHHPEDGVRTLAWALSQTQSRDGFRKVLCLLEEVWGWPPRLPPQYTSLLAQVACRAREPEHLERLLEAAPPEPTLELYRAWLEIFYEREGQLLSALQRLEVFELTAQGSFETGLSLRLRGECLALLERPVAEWRPWFEAAETHLRGVALGICKITQAGHLYRVRETAPAWRLWAESLALLRHDPYYQAWTTYHVAMLRLQEGEPLRAEQLLLDLVRLCARPALVQFRALAQCGLGAVRRTLGERGRALHHYQEAVRLAERGGVDPEDHESALWGVGMVLRQLGHTDAALVSFELAQAVQHSPWLNLERAVCALHLGDSVHARALVNPGCIGGGRTRNLYWLLVGDLARRERDEAQVEAALAQVDYHRRDLREEVMTFPALLEGARHLGHPVPPGIPEVPMVVRVRAEGVLQVEVCGRAVAFKAHGLPAVALAILLEERQGVRWHSLARVLFEGRSGPEVALRQALWNHLAALREALGWPDSVRSVDGVVWLDPAAQWHYDIEALERQGQRPQAFLQGVDHTWVLERWRRWDLEGLDG